MCQIVGHLFPSVFDVVAFMIILKVYPLLFLMCAPHQRLRGLNVWKTDIISSGSYSVDICNIITLS